MALSIFALFQNSLEVYEHLCKPVCEQAGILQGELNILLFLANNPDMNTAMDIHKNGGMKQSMISNLVERLVFAGYLVREAIPGDRRRVKLVCTEKAGPVVQEGREVQKRLLGICFEGTAPEDLEAYRRVAAQLAQNILSCRKKMLKGEL